MSDSHRPQRFHCLANDIRTSNLARMRHEVEPGGPRALNQAGQRRRGDRLVADQADTDDSFGRERDVEGSFIGCGGPTPN